jgi:hypothetical protein
MLCRVDPLVYSTADLDLELTVKDGPVPASLAEIECPGGRRTPRMGHAPSDSGLAQQDAVSVRS